MTAATTAAIVGMAATAASGVMQAIGSANQAGAQSAQALYQAQIARRNAQRMEWNAQRAEQQGRVDEQNARQKAAQVLGAQRAALASQGGDVNSGSPLDIQADTARAGEYDAQTIRNNASIQAYNFRNQSADLLSSASASDAAAANSMANLPFSVGSSLLGTTASIAGKVADLDWSKNKNPLSGTQY